MQHRDEVVVQCENNENVHIRKCNGVGHPVLIRIEVPPPPPPLHSTIGA